MASPEEMSDTGIATLRISIVTVNRDNREGLLRTVESVEAQESNSLEFIVIDGASSDGSAELLRSGGAGRARWVSEPDSGIYAAMNKGIGLSRGEYLLFLNSGDRLASHDTVGNLLGILDSGADIYYADLLIADGTKSSQISYPHSISPDFFITSTISHQNSLIRRGLLLEAGCYREDFRIASDWFFFLDASLRLRASFRWIDTRIAVMEPGGIGSDPGLASVRRKEHERGFEDAFGALAPAMRELASYRSSSFGHLVGLFGNSKVLDFLLRVYSFFARRLPFLRTNRGRG